MWLLKPWANCGGHTGHNNRLNLDKMHVVIMSFRGTKLITGIIIHYSQKKRAIRGTGVRIFQTLLLVKLLR
ncbi:hypothetical protein XELAEV_18017750mg [Xenopus laevis]|uniref:Uncharacterized protein n=1 Tax=Xenopus laevis TaxID=8355 RepID=A0A974HT64_XENLA|nr:hypothetical protein XELAEV_18017750mg [Xenopus laevis]